MMWWNPWRAAREALDLVAEQREVLDGQQELIVEQEDVIAKQAVTVGKLQRTVLEQHKLLSRAVFRDPKTGRMMKAKK